MIKALEKKQFDTEIHFHFWVERLIRLFQYFVYTIRTQQQQIT